MMIASHHRLSNGRLLGWLGGLAGAVLLHAGVIALLLWSDSERGQAPPEPQGAIMVELEMAEASPSDQQGESADLTAETAAPPPSPTESEDPPADQPSGTETAPLVEPSPQVAKAPEAEPTPEQPLPELSKEQPSEDAPPLAEAPLVPEPAVTLPKEVRKDEAPKPETKAEKADKVQPEKQQRGVATAKSDSKKEQKAAASSKGKFNPNPVYQTHPAYPASARSKGLEGSVTVTYSVSASGSVTGVRVVSSSPPGVFDGAVISAVSKWRFNPPAAPIGGLRKTIRFKLR